MRSRSTAFGRAGLARLPFGGRFRGRHPVMRNAGLLPLRPCAGLVGDLRRVGPDLIEQQPQRIAFLFERGILGP